MPTLIANPAVVKYRAMLRRSLLRFRKKGGEAVSLTSEAQQLNGLQEKAMNSSGIDQAKVDKIKADIESGSYKINVEQLANKLAQFESDLFSNGSNE